MHPKLTVPLFLLLVACGRTIAPNPGEDPAPIVVAQPRKVQDYERVSVSGSLVPPGAPTLVAFLVPGRVVEVVPREGQRVRKGELLAALDAVTLTHALEAAAAQAQAAKAGAQAAEQEYQRMRQLFANQSLAPNDFAKSSAARDASEQQYQQARAGEEIATRNLAEAQLRAPISGFITRRMVEPGAMVAPGQPVFELTILDPIEVNVGVPETDIRLLKVGQAAEVTIPALPGRTFKGTVRVVNVAADPATRTYMTRVSVPNPARELKLGMVAEVSITGTQWRDTTVLPMEALVRDPQGATLVFQYFPDQRRVFSKRVEVGALLGSDVQIREGLKGDEAIVIAGQHALRNGMAAEPASARR